MPTDKYNVVVDLDGVLAEYHGWQGEEHIGAPIKGAREFLEELGKRYRIVVATARINSTRGKESMERNFVAVTEWLEQNNMPYDGCGS